MKKLFCVLGVSASILLAGCQQSTSKPVVSDLKLQESSTVSALRVCYKDRTIRRGSRGATVRKLQRMLNESMGTRILAVDGIFGPKTDAFVREFQYGLNLKVDGIVGPQTWGALYDVLNRGC